MRPLRAAWQLARDSFTLYQKDDIPRLGAALSYYTVFSIGPLLLVVISVTGFFFGRAAATGRVFSELQGLLGERGAAAVQGIVENADKPKAGLIASVIGMLTFLLAATGAFVELKHALNVVWGAVDKAPSGLKGFVRDRLLSFTMVLVIGFLLMVSLIASASLTVAADWVLVKEQTAILLQIANLLLSLTIFSLLMAAIFKFLPDTHIAWKDVWVGALVTTVLFLIGRYALSATIVKSSDWEVYGAAGSLVLVLVWTYYCAQIFLLGAAVTYSYAQRFGSRKDEPTPDRTAPKVPAGVPATPPAPPAAPHYSAP